MIHWMLYVACDIDKNMDVITCEVASTDVDLKVLFGKLRDNSVGIKSPQGPEIQSKVPLIWSMRICDTGRMIKSTQLAVQEQQQQHFPGIKCLKSF